MKPASLGNTVTKSFDTDFRAEVVAAEMVDNGVPAEQIMIMLLGSLKRAYRKDVEAVSEELSEYNHKEYTLVKTHKEGIYDMLPEGLFHTAALPKSATTESEIMAYIKRHRVEERNARRFFLPFEAAINHLRIQLALYESRLNKGAQHSELVEIFSQHWEIFRYLDTHQSNTFLQVIPLINEIRDDYETAQRIFELIFLLPITILSRQQRPIAYDNPAYSNLNDARLGIDLTTGNEHFYGGEAEIVISIGPIDNAQLKRFLPGSRNNKILELLCDYLLPVHLELIVEYELSQPHRLFRLADKSSDENATLGLSTFL